MNRGGKNYEVEDRRRGPLIAVEALHLAINKQKKRRKKSLEVPDELLQPSLCSSEPKTPPVLSKFR